MMIVELDRKDAVLLAMSDRYMRRILCSMMVEAKSIEQIERENGIPLITCYGRIHELVNLGLVKKERTIITRGGKKHEIFWSMFTDPKITFISGDISVEVTPLGACPDSRPDSTWMETKLTDSSDEQPPVPVSEIRAR